MNNNMNTSLKQNGLYTLLITMLLFISSQGFAVQSITFYHNDVLGSPVAATDENGNICWREDYQPYGEKLNNNDGHEPSTAGCGLDDNQRGYTGHVHDKDIGLTYMQARYYDPVIGRFMGIDPIGVQLGDQVSFNRYAYGGNNPYKYIDPDGMDNFWVGGAGDAYSFAGRQPTGIMRRVMNNNSTLFSGPNHYRGYEDESAIIDAINKTPGKHNIVGHSWGGAAGIDITAAVDPGKVGTLITLDAVSYGPKSDPLNYDTWINVHQVQTPIDYVGSIPVVGDLIKLLSPLDVGGAAGDSVATVGGQLGAESGAVNIPSTNGHGEAGRMLDQAESHMQQQNSTPNPNN